jgi:hypothetical protein
VSGHHQGPWPISFLLEVFFRQLRVCYFVAPSLTRGRVCNLLLLQDIASAVPLVSESRGTQDHILLSQFLRLLEPGGLISRVYILQSQNHVTTDVSQYVLISSSLRNLWPDIIFSLKVAVLSLWGSHPDERSDLSPVSDPGIGWPSYTPGHWVPLVTIQPTVRPPSGTRDQFFVLEFFFRQLRVWYSVAPTLTRGRACLLSVLSVTVYSQSVCI